MLDTLVQGLLIGGVYGLIALGFVLVFKSSHVLNMAYGWIIAMISYFLYQLMEPWGLPTWGAIPLMMVAGAVMGVLVERFAVRPLISQSFLAIMMMTLAVGFVLRGLIVLIWPGRVWTVPFKPMGLWTIAGIKIMPDAAIAFLAASAVFVVLVLFFRYTTVGLSMRVVAADHEVAQSLGIRVNRIFTLSWAISGAFGGICGVLTGMVFTVSILTADIVLGKGMTILLVGGLNSIPGAYVGGLLIGAVELLGGRWLTGLKEVVPWLFMLIVLLIRPQGLLGERKVERI